MNILNRLFNYECQFKHMYTLTGSKVQNGFDGIMQNNAYGNTVCTLEPMHYIEN